MSSLIVVLSLVYGDANARNNCMGPPPLIVAVRKARETHRVRRYGMFLLSKDRQSGIAVHGFGVVSTSYFIKMAADLLFLLR